MERKEIICSAYRMTGGNNFYDGMITCSTLSEKAACCLVWAMFAVPALKSVCRWNSAHLSIMLAYGGSR